MDRLVKCILTAVTVAGLGALTYTEGFAQAGPPCAPTEELVAKLKKDYNEVEVGGGLINEHGVIVTYASPEGETWTILAVGTEGVSCIVSSGEHWFVGSLPKAGDPA